MAKKKQNKKISGKKSVVKAKSASKKSMEVWKKSELRASVNNRANITHRSSGADKPLLYATYFLLALALSYGFASWAIDSGSLWHYLFCFIAVYYAVSYFKKFVKTQFFNNDSKTKASKRA